MPALFHRLLGARRIEELSGLFECQAFFDGRKGALVKRHSATLLPRFGRLLGKLLPSDGLGLGCRRRCRKLRQPAKESGRIQRSLSPIFDLSRTDVVEWRESRLFGGLVLHRQAASGSH